MTRRSKPSYTQRVLLLLIAIWFDPALGWGAEASRSLRAIILFDVSGSMRHNDPQRLSIAAAQLFVDLAQPQDAVGLVVFSDRGVPLVPLRYAHTRMQRDLQNKKLIVKRTMEESDLLSKQRVSLQSTVREIRSANARLSGHLEIKERLLQQCKAEGQELQQLRAEVRTLKTRLAGREADVERLQTEKAGLAEEYAVLSKEYERMYASFLK